jgi:hypothetical protein
MTEFDGKPRRTSCPAALLVSSPVYFQFWPCAPRYRWHHRGRPRPPTAFRLARRSVSPIRIFLVGQRSAHRRTIALPRCIVAAAEGTQTGTATINAAISFAWAGSPGRVNTGGADRRPAPSIEQPDGLAASSGRVPHRAHPDAAVTAGTGTAICVKRTRNGWLICEGR